MRYSMGYIKLISNTLELNSGFSVQAGSLIIIK